jgi:predicted GH43/DUF377 family glycosyl hydrolase
MLTRFREEIEAQLGAVDGLGALEAVVGIPCRSLNADAVVIDTVKHGLAQMGLSGTSLIVVVGCHDPSLSADGDPPFDATEPVPILRLSLQDPFRDHGWRVLALVHAAANLHVPLLLLPDGLVPQANGADETDRGFAPHWIRRMLVPVYAQDQDIALARFNRHPLTNPVESLLLYPVMAGVFGMRLRQAASGVLALSYRLVEEVHSLDHVWPADAGDHGVDAWLTMRAISTGMSVCEVPLGTVALHHALEEIKSVFHGMAHTILEEVAHNEAWSKRADPVRYPNVAGVASETPPGSWELSVDELRHRFRQEFDLYDQTLYPTILPERLRRPLEEAATTELSPHDWIGVIGNFLLAYRFDPRFDRNDIVDGLFAFFLARLVSFIGEVNDMQKTYAAVPDADFVVFRECERRLHQSADIFVARWPDFRKEWHEQAQEAAPYLPRLGAWEFVPNVGVIVPQELEVEGGHNVWASQVYKEVIDQYRVQYIQFANMHLVTDDPTNSSQVLKGLQKFMSRLEHALAKDVFPQDTFTADGAREVVETIIQQFAEAPSFHLTPTAARTVLEAAPPRELITQMGCGSVRGLLEKMSPLDALATAAASEQQRYLSRVLDILESRAQPDWFEKTTVAPHIIQLEGLSTSPESFGTAALVRLAGRIVMFPTRRHNGNDYPTMWLMLRLAKSIVSVELFSRIWEEFATKKPGFGKRLVQSIRGHWGRRVLSAYNAFENRQQRIVVERLKGFAQQLSKGRAGELLGAAADVYHLSITLPDATFVPLSAWTWASFRSRGGSGVPTPLSALVERDWSTRDFLTTYLTRAQQADEASIDAKVFELVGKGRESEDLRTHMMGVTADPDELVVPQSARTLPPPAANLTRPLQQPLLEPTANKWESRYVLNPAALWVDGNIYILYRAYGDDEVSRIGLAWTKDGIHIDGRLDEPVFSPAKGTEEVGCEDPRTVIIDGRIYMLYTAWDGTLPQIAMSSITIDAFLERRWDQWKRHGLAFPGLSNKDAVLYPEKINGRYVAYHRLDPNMWVSQFESLACPWPRRGQQIFASPRPGMMWDGVKIGAGGPPIKTTHGWLNIYHGVDYERSYRLGVMLMALDDPTRVLYRSPNAILEPSMPYELGDSLSWVPHVVFTCGAVPAEDKAVIGPDDEILVYYGSADTVIGVAKGRLSDMVPTLEELALQGH